MSLSRQLIYYVEQCQLLIQSAIYIIHNKDNHTPPLLRTSAGCCAAALLVRRAVNKKRYFSGWRYSNGARSRVFARAVTARANTEDRAPFRARSAEKTHRRPSSIWSSECRENIKFVSLPLAAAAAAPAASVGRRTWTCCKHNTGTNVERIRQI